MGWAVLTAHVRESVIPTVCCHSRKLSTLVLDLPLRSSSMMHLVLGLFFWFVACLFPIRKRFHCVFTCICLFTLLPSHCWSVGNGLCPVARDFPRVPPVWRLTLNLIGVSNHLTGPVSGAETGTRTQSNPVPCIPAPALPSHSTHLSSLQFTPPIFPLPFPIADSPDFVPSNQAAPFPTHPPVPGTLRADLIQPTLVSPPLCLSLNLHPPSAISARSLSSRLMSPAFDDTDHAQRERSRSPRRRSRSPRRSRRSYSPRSRSRSRDDYRRSDRRSRSPMSTTQGAPGGHSASGYGGRSSYPPPPRSFEDRAVAKEQMMQAVRESSQQDRRVYVGNLSYDVKWHHLKDFMRQGEQGHIVLPGV